MPVEELRQSRETLRRYLTPAVRASDLARAAGVSRQYVSDVVRGHRSPSAKLLAAAAELGIPVASAKQATGGAGQ